MHSTSSAGLFPSPPHLIRRNDEVLAETLRTASHLISWDGMDAGMSIGTHGVGCMLVSFRWLADGSPCSVDESALEERVEERLMGRCCELSDGVKLGERESCLWVDWMLMKDVSYISHLMLCYDMSCFHGHVLSHRMILSQQRQRVSLDSLPHFTPNSAFHALSQRLSDISSSSSNHPHHSFNHLLMNWKRNRK